MLHDSVLAIYLWPVVFTMALLPWPTRFRGLKRYREIAQILEAKGEGEAVDGHGARGPGLGIRDSGFGARSSWFGIRDPGRGLRGSSCLRFGVLRGRLLDNDSRGRRNYRFLIRVGAESQPPAEQHDRNCEGDQLEPSTLVARDVRDGRRQTKTRRDTSRRSRL